MKRDAPRIFMLRVSSWRGISFNAEHWYGKIVTERYEREEVELTRKLSAEEARSLTEKDNWGKKDGPFKWRKGSRSTRFDSKEAVVEAALLWFEKNGRDGDVLMDGDHAEHNPRRALAGPRWFIKQANRLYERGERVGGWEGSATEMKKICAEWDLLLSKRRTSRRRRGK